MLPKNQKGQGLTEFALILPLLLLLILGIIEGARIIWAFITVQTAAREAARFAVTGKPYLIPENIDSKSALCRTPDGEVNGSEPWMCYPANRVEAVKEMAVRRGRTLNVSQLCLTPAQFESQLCLSTPGAFGVRVTGQIISSTVSLTTPVAVIDHPGTQGLNVRVETYYNVQMIDPVIDFVMGGQSVHLRGEVEMQNEGVESALGSVPPKAIGRTNVLTSSLPPGVGPNGEEIWALNYTVNQYDNLPVHLESHFQASGPYDIYLENDQGSHKICSGVATDIQNQADTSCLIDGLQIPPGDYDLYSTFFNAAAHLATAPEPVKVKMSNTPNIVIDGGNVWAANSDISIRLIAHQVPDEPFNVYFNYGGPNQQLLTTTPITAATGPIMWQVPNVNVCPQNGATACTIQSRKVSAPSQIYAETKLYINQPQIVLAGGNMVYAAGETIYVFLRSHTPNYEYDLKMECAANGTQYLGHVKTDKWGDTTDALMWVVLDTWLNDTCSITSHPLATPPNMLGSNKIGELLNVIINTPTSPYITVDGGYVWPIDSFINIKVHKHQALTPHYLKFGPWPVMVSPTSSLFTTGAAGTAVVGYHIPITATQNVQASFIISSFLASNNSRIATRQVTVYPVPVIYVLQGNTAMPDEVITIVILNHAPKTPYRITYAGEYLLDILTDANGNGQRTFDLKMLSASNPAVVNYGTAYPLVSWQKVAGTNQVATTNFTIRPADLLITQIQLPSQLAINTTIPVTVTVRNQNAVTVARTFDVDMYLYHTELDAKLPKPSFMMGQVGFPGEYKNWVTFLGPNAQTTVKGQLRLGRYGSHTTYGFADTSNYVYGETSETNNITSTTFIVPCALTTTKTYNFVNATELNDWTNKNYSSGTVAASISSGRLRLNHGMGSNGGATDTHAIYYVKNPVTATKGLDVQVQIVSALNSAANAKVGITIRSSTDANSGKIDFALAAHAASSASYHVQAMARITNAASLGYAYKLDGQQYTSGTETQLQFSNGSIWLRVVRDPGSNTYKYYYKQGSGAWIDYARVTATLGDQLYIGLFGSNNNATVNSDFDDFIYVYGSCADATGPIDPGRPPGEKLCWPMLKENGFEDPSPLDYWVPNFGEGVHAVGTPKHSGFYSIMVPSYDGGRREPDLYQPFIMPNWVISTTTTLDVNLFKYIEDFGTADPGDILYAVVLAGPSLASTQITSPTAVARGDGSASWAATGVSLPAASGINLENYAGQTLYFYLYNNTNGSSCSLPFCADTRFFLDDVYLDVCTTQPEPQTISTLIKGTVQVSVVGGKTQTYRGDRVWVYSQGGQLYQTTTIQNGEFNFYNLPASLEGIKYVLYAEHVVAGTGSEPKVLANSVTVLLKNSNDKNNPVITRIVLSNPLP